CRLIDECTKCDQSLNNSTQYRDSLGQSEFRPSVDYSQTKSNNNNSNVNNAYGCDGEDNDDFDVSRRLRRRNELFDFRRKLTDYSLLVAVLGVILMIVENELTTSFNDFRYKISLRSPPLRVDLNPNAKIQIEKTTLTMSLKHTLTGVEESIYSYCLKSLIVMFTLLLLALIVWFHAVEIMIFMSDNSCDDWRIAITRKRVLTLSIELLICSICPVPGELYFDWPTVHANGVTRTVSKVPIDVLLSIPMFLSYIQRKFEKIEELICCSVDQSIDMEIMQNLTIETETLMTSSPGTVLLTLTLSFWLIAAWVMRACERWHVGDPPQVEAEKFQNYLNSLWLIAITSLTVGYGDMVPNTYCGRAVSVICGMMGAGTSSLVVAVVAKKLELTRAEKHVHYFMMDSQLAKMLKTAAANVLRETWLIYKHRKL
uniref:Uncharacterized protein n=1 Tax=Romanomermis culicivorax TaxID=13658 RepID=A0A915IFX1_ROMCU